MTYPSIDRIAELQQFIANFADIERTVHLADSGRPENDVDHSYGLALTCWFLAPKIAPELSLEKILRYALAHDIVELHAGDTYIFSSAEELSTKPEREAAALQRLETEWPDFADMTAAAKGYMEKADEEAKFVKAIDKLLPPLMANLGQKEAFWHEHKITRQMEKENKLSLKISDYVAPYYEKLLAWLDETNYFYDEGASKPSENPNI